MANSKHAHLRYNILDYCFRKKAFTFNELLEYVNDKIEEYYPGESISERTLREDIKLFRDSNKGFGAPLPNNVRILKYDNPNFSIATKPLLEYENYLIDAAIQLLQRFENHPKYDKLAEALFKFQDNETLENNTDYSKIVFFDHNEEYKGIKHLKPLYLAIRNKNVLKITYKGFNDDVEKSFDFHPHVLKQYNKRWFVFGYNESSGVEKWSIPLDERLIKYETMEGSNYISTSSNWELHFREMVGVVRPINSEKVKVVLKFYNGREHYFKTKPFFADYEEFFENEKQDQVWFETIINNELVQQLLSYGKDVEVLEPESLKTQMKNHSKSMQQFYEE